MAHHREEVGLRLVSLLCQFLRQTQFTRSYFYEFL
ncbi:Uncharacterised protein [Vibrio cholerae]|nr:Uncharacterised protein [Vibrio cholerae]CSA91522.1 Uncharacterised protein [Vibrio cholerae]CSB13890.1 Uncharacterised protein [Vibrio cholerae]CSB23304.1 Uncharacterised protein [Vibrio cholerae]CSC23709.1 Uncharacterised protein [Vibrio cholerae]